IVVHRHVATSRNLARLSPSPPPTREGRRRPMVASLLRKHPMSTLPSQITAIAIREPGPPDVLVPQQRPMPAPWLGEVLITVAAAVVSGPAVIQREGLYPPTPGASDIPGPEIAGEVAALGMGASRFKPGDKVTALVSGGGYAQFCPVHETNALPVPAS